jgi:uncharacterized membrane protein
MWNRTLTSIAILLMVLIDRRVSEAAEFKPLGDLAGGPTTSKATSLSEDGTVVVGTATDSVWNHEAVMWDIATNRIVRLGRFAKCVQNGSDDPSGVAWEDGGKFWIVVGGGCTDTVPNGQGAWYWAGLGLTELFDYPTEKPWSAGATGIAATAKAIVGAYRDGSAMRAFR